MLVGAVSIMYDALCAGAVGAVLGQAHFAPSLCVGLYEAFLHHRAKEARDLQQRLLPLARKIAVPYGVPGVKAPSTCSEATAGFHGFLCFPFRQGKERNSGRSCARRMPGSPSERGHIERSALVPAHP